ncbi:hypothetical protein BDZ85DRAFT_302523, partial [Elsinoe ampelina]
WALTGIAALLIFIRWAVRIRTVGFRGFQGDDYVSIGTLCFTIMDAATVTVAFKKGQNVDLSPAMIEKLTEADIARITWGSKVELAAWYSYITLIWCLKFTLLFFYQRLTLGSFNAKLVRYLFWIIGITYIALFLVVTVGCRPFKANWQVSPMAPWQCSFRPQNLIATAVLNTTTDAALLVIPVILLYQLKVSLSKKLVIGLILSSGVFVIIAAIIRAQLSLGNAPTAANINSWGVRETVIGVFTVNVPILRPLFRRSFWTTGAYNPQSSSKRSANATGPSQHATASHRAPTSTVNDWKDDIEKGQALTDADATIIKSSQVVHTIHVQEEDEEKSLGSEKESK